MGVLDGQRSLDDFGKDWFLTGGDVFPPSKCVEILLRVLMLIAPIPGMFWILGWTSVVDGIPLVAMRSLGGGAKRFDEVARFDGARRFDDGARFDGARRFDDGARIDDGS